MAQNQIKVFAPAKINLYLHVTGRLDDGYHTLDSLVNFADIGDDILIQKAEHFAFDIEGPFAKEFPTDARKATDESSNLIVKAVFALAKKLERLPDFKITLTKNLPLASGIGGGSSNAAAAIWGMLQWWGLSDKNNSDWLSDIFMQLGADVPVCYACQPALMRGIGNIITPAPPMPEMNILLVNPLIPCSTPEIFSAVKPPYTDEIILPQNFSTQQQLIDFLKKQKNDLTAPACEAVSDIHTILKSLKAVENCKLARLSGSGATCFGLFTSRAEAQNAAAALKEKHPKYWIQTGTLGGIDRY